MAYKFCMFLLFVSFANVNADTPANCTYGDLVGEWNFYIKDGGHNNSVNCTKSDPIKTVIKVKLDALNKAIKVSDGEIGKFTLIYNQGFEVEIGFRKYFAFFEWEQKNATQAQYWCNRTMFGWSHDTTQHDWACFVAVKQNSKWSKPSMEFTENHFPPMQNNFNLELTSLLAQKYSPNEVFIQQINLAQKSWKAEQNDIFDGHSFRDVLSMSGYSLNKLPKPDVPKPTLDYATQAAIKKLPESFDWRNVEGVNYVSPVRNQGQCGSCYAFSSAAMLEARIRIMTNNTQKPVLSTQQVVGCSEYSQGCNGGFPYLIAGKYAQDFGFMPDSCYPYEGVDSKCKPAKHDCERTYAAGYRYVGGYYGGCTEDLMKLSLVRHGPVAVGFEVYPDFHAYKEGVYHHVFSSDEEREILFQNYKFNPFELTNHAVLVVGYGFDEKVQEKYWIVKNSWGGSWGEKGFFRIRRGNDECGIESLAVESFPIPQA